MSSNVGTKSEHSVRKETKDKAKDDKATKGKSESVSAEERNKEKKDEEKEKEKDVAKKDDERKGDKNTDNKDKAKDDKATKGKRERVSAKERNKEKKDEEKEKEKEKNNSDKETTEAVKNLQNLMLDLSTPKKNTIPLTPSNSPLKDVEGCFSPYTTPETSPLKGYAQLTADNLVTMTYVPSASSTCTATAPPPLVGIGVNTSSLLKLERIKENRVILNISGAWYITSKITIMNDKDSLLAEILKHNSPFTKTSTDTYYFDRDHTHFRNILNYLRNQCQVDLYTLPRDGAALRELLIEAFSEVFQIMRTRTGNFHPDE